MCTNRYVSNRECTVDTEELDTLKQAEQKHLESYIGNCVKVLHIVKEK